MVQRTARGVSEATDARPSTNLCCIFVCPVLSKTCLCRTSSPSPKNGNGGLTTPDNKGQLETLTSSWPEVAKWACT